MVPEQPVFDLSAFVNAGLDFISANPLVFVALSTVLVLFALQCVARAFDGRG